jgi:hypothetical protein
MARLTKRNPTRTFTLEALQEASEDMCGFCLACGEQREMCDPDARRYHCEACGMQQVYGAEEIVLMGMVA